jgi:hypothetical protein
MTKFDPASARPQPTESPAKDQAAPSVETPAKPEHGGPKGLEPTRYGDWERNGRCFDF